MAGNFKLKAQTIQAIQVGDPVVQAAEVAALVGATSFTTNLAEYAVTFAITDKEPVTVRAGEVVALIDGGVSVLDPVAFSELYEPA